MLDQPGDNPWREVHARLDAAVRVVYGMADDVDPLAFLLELNLACAARVNEINGGIGLRSNV
jgi:hypothetical protein